MRPALPDCPCTAGLIISADWQKLTKEEELEPNRERLRRVSVGLCVKRVL